MNKIKWCADQKTGLKIIKPNSDLCEAYIKKAEESLESMRSVKSKDWKISTSYYTIYFSLYALLTKIGIKSEIHSCTIEIMKMYLKEFFNEQELEFAETSQKARVNSQYYVDRSIPDAQFEMMIRLTPSFLVKCKDILIKLNEEKIRQIRSALKKDIQ